MAYENIEITNPNFCLTPQAGTFGTINTDDITTRFVVKNTTGGLVKDYTLSSNILNELVSVEYVGPLNLPGPIDNVTYFTLEKVPDYAWGVPLGTSSRCIIKRWELNVSFSLLSLKQQIIKYTTGNYYYDVSSLSVEHYHRGFLNPNQGGISYLDINGSSRVESSIKLFLGPSTDADNIGATETVTVSYVNGDRVYLNSNINYQYVAGDPITFYNNIYIVSSKGYGGVSTQGTIFKLDSSTGSLKEFTTSGEYVNVTGAKWSTMMESIALINNTQLLFVRPYDSYLNWRSPFLNNVTDGDGDSFTVSDIVFDNYNVYKLAKEAMYKQAGGDKVSWVWETYNYQQDSLLPYTNNVTIYTSKSVLIPPNLTVTLYIQVRDQFGVGLRDVNLNLYKDGADMGAEFDPLNGQTITDINGEATIDYTSGGLLDGVTEITIRADKSSPYTGSEYVWNKIRIQGVVSVSIDLSNGALVQNKEKSGDIGLVQIHDPYKNTHYKRLTGSSASELETTVPCIYTINYSYFTSPGGGWRLGGSFSSEYYPWFVLPPPAEREDGPSLGGGTYLWEPWVGPPSEGIIDYPYPRPNIIFSLIDFTQKQISDGYDEVKALIIKQPRNFLAYYQDDDLSIEDGVPPRSYLTQKLVADHGLQLSQLKLSKHTHYVNGQPQTELFTNVNLDQFIFVEDAVPKFWSSKNPREAYIWIRLRPFAFNLDGTTLRFYIREVYTENGVNYDTNYYEVTSLGTITYFDAGGGLLGVEFMYQPIQIFHHNAIVYVHLEIYDTAPDPNYIYVNYWFKIIPDFNSPYLLNMDPDREENYVPIDKNIYFEIKDDGAGIDINSLEVFLNSRIIIPTDIIKVSDYHYKITCGMSYDLQFDKSYMVGVKVSDISENRNVLRDSYRFFTVESSEPWFTGFDPRLCKRGMPRFTDVSFLVLGNGHGVDEDTIRLQVADKDVIDKSNILPIIYRVS
jgi:hypothetical protein